MFYPSPAQCAAALMLFTVVAPLAQAATEDAPVELDDYVVTASGYQQKIVNAPASISVISKEELEKKSYRSIVDAVQDIPGVFVTGGGNMQDISIRGMDDPYTLYLVDGRPVSAGRSVNTNGADGGKQIGLPPLSMVERIEVIRGPMSSLYGSEAMGGVVNVITRAAPDVWGGELGAQYTHSLNDISNDTWTTDLYLGGPLVSDTLGLELTGSFIHLDESDYAGGDDNAASNPESDTRSLGASLSWDVSEQNRLGFDYDYAKLSFDHAPGRSLPDDADPVAYDYSKEMFSLSHNGRYGRLSTTTYLQQDLSERVQTDDKKEEIITLNSQATYVSDRHVYTLGGRYKTETLVDETNGLLDANVAGATDTVDRWIAAVFVEAEWKLAESLGLTTGVRYDDDELFGGHLSPRAYLNWHSSERLTFKGGISTGYSQPSLANATAGFGRGTGGSGSPNLTADGTPISRALIVGNPDLKPETSVNYEAGFIWDDKAANLTASLMLFNTQFKDKIAEDRYCESPDVDRDDTANYACEYGGNQYYFLSTRKNIDEAELRGVESSVSYWVGYSLKLSGNYTYTESEQKTGDFAGEPLNKIPLHMANVNIDWYAAGELNVWGRINYRGETSDYLGRNTVEEGTPEYAFADIGVAYPATPDLRLKAGVYNVTNKNVSTDDYGVVLEGRRINAGLTYAF